MSLSNSSKVEIQKVVRLSYLGKNKGRVFRRIKRLKENLSYYDKLIQDLQHDIEFECISDVSMEEKVRHFNMLNDILNKRRKTKDMLHFYALVQNFYKKGVSKREFNVLKKRVNRFVFKTENRKYRKRATNKKQKQAV